MGDAERIKAEQESRIKRLEQDAEQIFQAHEDAETSLAKYTKEIANLETLLADSNAAQHEENQAKLRLQSKLRQVEEDRSSMEEQLEDAESAREGLASQINTLNSRLSERQKRIDEAEAE